jgi:hypothetical protein
LNRITGSIDLLIILFAFNPVKAQSKVTALDVLLDPDQAMLDLTKVFNNLLRQDYSRPDSFELEAIHNPMDFNHYSPGQHSII